MAHPCPICDLEPQVLELGRVKVDRRTMTLTIKGQGQEPIFPSDFAVLELLMCDPGRVWSWEQLCGQLDPVGITKCSSEGIRVKLTRLRKMLYGVATIENRRRAGWWIQEVQCPASALSGAASSRGSTTR